MSKRWSGHWRGAAALLLFLALGLWNLSGPPPWWDEGWTLSVARNVVERGSYARLLDGNLTAHGLEASIPVTELVALSFRLFGVGLWQGRLPGVLAAALALGLLFLMARRMFDQRVAWAALLVALLLAPHPQINALVQGRQVLAELPLFAVLLAAFLCGDRAARRQLWLFLPALCLWTLALALKAQTLPFLAVGMLSGAAVAALLRRWRYAAILLTGLIGAYLLLPLLGLLLNWLAAPPFQAKAVSGLVEIIAVVTEPGNRMFALTIFLTFGLPSMLGLLYGLWRVWNAVRAGTGDDSTVLQLTLIGLAGSWQAWFVLLSVGSPRYMFPPIFLAAPFLAALLDQLTNGYDLFGLLQRLTAPLRERRLSRASGAAWLASLILIVALPLGLLTLTRYYLAFSDDSAQRTADYLNIETPPGARIETYESELHFLLDRPYHWPPDQIHVELNKRSLLGRQTPIDYDPLAANPDYLVVGEFARGNQLYTPVIDAGKFRLLETIGGYQVYARVR